MFHKRNLTNLRSVRSTCEEDLKLLEATVAVLINSNSTLREENAKLNAEISVLRSNLNNLQADLGAYDDIIGNLNLTIEDLRGQITSLMNENSKLQADLNAANSTISSLNSQINSLNSQVTTLTADKNKLQADLNAANATISKNEKRVRVYHERLEKPILAFLSSSKTIKYDEVNKKFTIELGTPGSIAGMTWMPGEDDYVLNNKSGDSYMINWKNDNSIRIHKVDKTTSRNEVGSITLKYGKLTHQFNFKTLILEGLTIEDFYLDALSNSTWNINATKEGDEMNEFFKFLSLFK